MSEIIAEVNWLKYETLNYIEVCSFFGMVEVFIDRIGINCKSISNG